MDFTKYIEKKKKELRLENIKQVRQEIESSWVKEKINNHLKAFDNIFTYDEIKEQILTNDVVASKFCKDPNKQNLTEKLAGEVLGYTKLPQNGKNAIRFDDEGNITNICNGNTKAADFKHEDYYITQKYTADLGGAQTSQKNEVIDFLKRGSLQNKVMAIVDGKFWEEGEKESLKELFRNNSNVTITSISELTSKEI